MSSACLSMLIDGLHPNKRSTGNYTESPKLHLVSWIMWNRYHYSDVIKGMMASQITSLAIAYSTVYSGADQRKHQKFSVTGLCVGNSPVTGEFPAQMAMQWRGKWFHLMTSSWKVHCFHRVPAAMIKWYFYAIRYCNRRVSSRLNSRKFQKQLQHDCSMANYYIVRLGNTYLW